MNNLKISVVPLDITWTDIEENLFVTERYLEKVERNTDIVVLPELFSTGFISSPELLYKFAEEADNSATLQQIKKWAADFNFAIAGSLLLRKDEQFFNRGFFIEPSGEATFYDKVHLFSQSSEKRDFTAGESPIPIVRFRGWNVALAICYELRFPVWLRNAGNKYDLLIIPANWPAKRAYAWEHLLIARAIENQSYVVGANRSGKDDGGEYDDLSFVFNYLGKPISQKKSNGLVNAEINRDKLNDFRNSFPVICDADKFKIYR